MNKLTRAIIAIAATLGISSTLNAIASELVIYCGRGEDMMAPLIQKFEESSGIKTSVRYGGTAELAATILEEGTHSPADVFMAQDAGALGALSHHDLLTTLPADLTASVSPRFRSSDNTWVGASGRARVLVYNTNKLSEKDIPGDVFKFCHPAWNGRLGWAPENASFQSFVTALIIREGRERAKSWLECIKANNPRVFAKNSAIVAAVAAGEIDAGFVNHYYLHTAQRSQPDIPAANFYFPAESAGSLVNVAGAGILKSSSRQDLAEAFIRFLLGETGQRYFVEETAEYPTIATTPMSGFLRPLDQLPSLDIDLNDLDKLEETLELLHETGVL